MGQCIFRALFLMMVQFHSPNLTLLRFHFMLATTPTVDIIVQLSDIRNNGLSMTAGYHAFLDRSDPSEHHFDLADPVQPCCCQDHQ